MRSTGGDAKFPVVCVGGSAGGLDAYTRLLRHLPADMGVAIVIVNHLRTVATHLHEILPRYTDMPVKLITERLIIQPNHVFIIPAQRDLHVLDGEFRLEPISKPSSLWRNPPKFGCDKGERVAAGPADFGMVKRRKRARESWPSFPRRHRGIESRK